MIKKTRVFIIVFLLFNLVCCVSVASAALIQPIYNNVYYEQTSFSIDTNGVAHIYEIICGYDNVTSSIVAEVQIKKRGFLGIFWTDVDIGTSNNKWSDTIIGSNLSVEHTAQLPEAGTYKAIVKYTVNGSGGASDIINKEIEQTY